MGRLSRRNFLRLAGGAALVTALPASALAGVLNQLFRSSPRLRPALTPNEEFYVTSYSSPPDIRVEQWSLSIQGLVERPLALTYPQLMSRPAVSQVVTLECIGNGL